MQNFIDDLAARFLTLVAGHRQLGDQAKADIASAGIYTADEALHLGLVDQVGYFDDAIQRTTMMAGLPENASIIVYRRAEYPDDNLYNTLSGRPEMPTVNLINLGLAEAVLPLRSGYYYLWLPGPLP